MVVKGTARWLNYTTNKKARTRRASFWSVERWKLVGLVGFEPICLTVMSGTLLPIKLKANNWNRGAGSVSRPVDFELPHIKLIVITVVRIYCLSGAIFHIAGMEMAGLILVGYVSLNAVSIRHFLVSANRN